MEKPTLHLTGIISIARKDSQGETYVSCPTCANHFPMSNFYKRLTWEESEYNSKNKVSHEQYRAICPYCCHPLKIQEVRIDISKDRTKLIYYITKKDSQENA
jgi:hypothetical protein